jgi:two-component system nitrate/nitrite response regulator NarL
MRVAIVAPHAAARSLLRAMADAAGLEVVEEGASTPAAARLAAEADVLVIDDGPLLRELLEQHDVSDLAIVVVADNRRMANALERAGLRGWAIVSPDHTPAELQGGDLAAAARAAHAGFSLMPATWTARAADPIAVPLLSDDGLDGSALDERLTTREQEVLELLASGLSNRRIAERLGISEHTVKFHVNAIYGKLDASSRTEAVNHALRRGILRL